MKLRQVIIWLVLLAVAVAVTLWLEDQSSQKAQREEVSNRVVELRNPRMVASLEVSGSEVAKPIKVERRPKEHRWLITTPTETEADSAVMDNVLNSFMSAAIKSRLDDQKDLAPFGLNPPRYRLVLSLTDSSQSELLLGKVSPTREYVYAAKPGSNQVWMIGAQEGRGLFVGLHDLRSKTVLDFVAADVTRLELQSPGKAKPLVLVRKQGGAKPDWRFSSGGRTDPEEVVDLLYQVHGLQATGFEDQPGDLKAKGLEPPAGMVVLGLASGKRVGILIGKLTKDKKHRYIRRLSGGSVLILGQDSIKRLKREREALAFRRIWDIDRRDVASLRISTGGKTVVYGRPKGMWVRTQPPGDKKSGEVASLLVWELANLRWQKILPKSKDYGLAKPRAVIRVEVKQPRPNGQPVVQPVTRTLKVGSVDKGTGLLAVSINGDKQVFGVKPEFAGSVPGLAPLTVPSPGKK